MCRRTRFEKKRFTNLSRDTWAYEMNSLIETLRAYLSTYARKDWANYVFVESCVSERLV